MQYLTNVFGQVYGSCSYGGSGYQANSCQTTAGGSSVGSSVLTNTGFDLVLIVTIACVLVFAALVVRIWRRPKKQPPSVPPKS